MSYFIFVAATSTIAGNKDIIFAIIGNGNKVSILVQLGDFAVILISDCGNA